jgi:Superfamily I DNA and RNA helicases
MMKDDTEALFMDNYIDAHVDEEIKQCFSENNYKSFFMFAGAGSGKTRSLINTLSFLDKEMGEKLSIHGNQIAVITYTNAACDEISRRLQYKPIFAISTIHSFLWELIKNYQTDIKERIIEYIKKDIADLEEQQSRGRGGDAALKREKKIKRKTERLGKIESVKKFSYNPSGESVDYDSLNHSEVIKLGIEFIATEEVMQKILVCKYPFLLIDESQDTNKELIDALFDVHEKYKSQFSIGMFGDTMQRIYPDGKDDLTNSIPDDWAKPKKVMNHRSAMRIVNLANAIRNTVDGQSQQARSDAEMGTICLFVAKSTSNKEAIEQQIAKKMAEKTGDDGWVDVSKYKSLILEHHMAASRLDFSNLYTPLNKSGLFDTALRDGSIPELFIFSNIISPLVDAYHKNDDFEVSKILRQHSPLLGKKVFYNKNNDQDELLQAAENAMEDLLSLWKDSTTPTCLDVLLSIKKTNLLKLGNRMDDILEGPIEDEDPKISVLREALSVSFDELGRYSAYVTGNTRFATHQGIKGLEFPRVMVIMDDAEAKGNSFSYEKLFGAKSKTDTDIKNEQEGKDTSIMRTARLFYVACTRAQKSLAIIAYTENINAVKQTALSNEWFSNEEIELLQ